MFSTGILCEFSRVYFLILLSLNSFTSAKYKYLSMRLILIILYMYYSNIFAPTHPATHCQFRMPPLTKSCDGGHLIWSKKTK